MACANAKTGFISVRVSWCECSLE